MNLAPARKPLTLLFNPFVYIAGAPALGLGVASILLAGLIASVSHTHFDGVLDVHSGAGAPFGFFLAEGLIDWVCVALTLWLLGKISSRAAFRPLDLWGTQALARWPYLLISVVTLPSGFQRFRKVILAAVTQPGTNLAIDPWDAIVFCVAALAMLPLICWIVALMYQSYSVSCHIKGGRAIGTFIAGLILAEILSKMALYELFKLA
jgi:hypothetical protein